jgi:cell wall assembly regulator SMI1
MRHDFSMVNSGNDGCRQDQAQEDENKLGQNTSPRKRESNKSYDGDGKKSPIRKKLGDFWHTPMLWGEPERTAGG